MVGAPATAAGEGDATAATGDAPAATGEGGTGTGGAAAGLGDAAAAGELAGLGDAGAAGLAPSVGFAAGGAVGVPPPWAQAVASRIKVVSAPTTTRGCCVLGSINISSVQAWGHHQYRGRVSSPARPAYRTAARLSPIRRRVLPECSYDRQSRRPAC